MKQKKGGEGWFIKSIHHRYPFPESGLEWVGLLLSKIKPEVWRIFISKCLALGRNKKIHEMKRCLRQCGDFVPERHLGPFPGKGVKRLSVLSPGAPSDSEHVFPPL